MLLSRFKCALLTTKNAQAASKPPTKRIRKPTQPKKAVSQDVPTQVKGHPVKKADQEDVSQIRANVSRIERSLC
jgi:hypothetical protein